MKRTFDILACLTALTLLFTGCGIEEQAPIAPEVMHGNVVHVETYNGYYVYTPPNYNANASYPVLYLLNGFGRDEGYFVNTFSATDAADYLLDDRLIGPLIMVMPSGESALGGTFYTNSLHPAVGMAENNILAVIHEVEANYAIDTTKRAIGGHSMGGYGALSIALNHPGMFKAIAVMEAQIAFWGSMPASPQYKGMWEVLPAVLLETGYADVMANTGGAGDAALYKQMMYPSPARRVTSMMFAMASAFSPTQFDPDTHFPIYVPTTIDSIIVGMNGDVPIKSPMWVDLPMGINGSVEMAVWSRWMAKDCLARFAGGQAANIAGVKLYLDAGNQDDLGLYGAHQTFSMAYQMALGGASPANETYFSSIPDIFGDIPGGHTQQVYEQLRKLLIWHSGQF